MSVISSSQHTHSVLAEESTTLEETGGTTLLGRSAASRPTFREKEEEEEGGMGLRAKRPERRQGACTQAMARVPTALTASSVCLALPGFLPLA